MSVPALNVAYQGISQTSASNLNTFEQTCNIVTDLRAFVGITGMQVFMRGYTSIGDGGQGIFYWNASGTAPDDGGVTTIVPNGSSSGCWTRLSVAVSSITSAAGSITVSSPTGAVNIEIGPIAANSVFANATTGSARPTGISLGANNLLGRGSSGNIVAISTGSSLSFAGNVLNATIYSAIAGCLPSAISGSNTTASITVSTGQATDSTNATTLIGAGYTWLASNGNAINGSDATSSTLANSSTYHMFLISGASGTGTYASTSLTPTLPTGYNTYKRRIFGFNTNSSGSPIPYIAREIEGGAMLAWLTTQILDINTSSLSTSRVLFTLTVPTGIQVNPIMRLVTATGANLAIISSPDETDIAPATNVANVPGFDVNATNVYSHQYLTTNTSGQIAARASAGSTTLYGTTRGFIDFRRS